MGKLEVVKFLIQEIEDEKKLFELYDADIEQAKAQSKKAGNGYYWNYLKYKGRKPSKARIIENCKKIRQIMIDMSKEESVG